MSVDQGDLPEVPVIVCISTVEDTSVTEEDLTNDFLDGVRQSVN